MDNAAFSADDGGGLADTPAAGLRKLRPSAGQPAPTAATSAAKAAEADDGRVRLPRTIGIVSGTAILVGTIIGAGIFVSPKAVLAGTGSVALSLIVWLVCSVYSACGALCFVELGLLIPESGAEFAYLLHGFGPLHPSLGRLPAFLQAWTYNLISQPAGLAILSLAFAHYCLQPFYAAGCHPPPAAVSLLAVAVYWLEAFLNCYSTRLVTRAQNAFTVAKLAAIAIIVVAGAYSLSQGNSRHLSTGFQGSKTSPGDLATAFFSGIFAYGGWNNLNDLTEEVVEPARTLPRALLITISLVTACYLSVNVAYLTVLSPREILDSSAVVLSFAERILGAAAFLMPLGVVLSVFGALNGGIMSVSRLYLVAARHGHFVRVASFVHVRRLTPAPAIIFNTAIATAWICVGDIDRLLRYTGFTGSLVLGLTMVSLLVMRTTMPDAERPYRVPLFVPCLVIAVCCFLFVAPIAKRPDVEYVYVLVFLAVGVLVYIPCVHLKWAPPGMERLTLMLQKMFEIAPSATVL